MKKRTVIKIVAPILAAAAVYATAEIVRKQHEKKNYICPHCGEVFKPGILEFCFGRKRNGQKKLVCPVCGMTGNCEEALIIANETD